MKDIIFMKHVILDNVYTRLTTCGKKGAIIERHIIDVRLANPKQMRINFSVRVVDQSVNFVSSPGVLNPLTDSFIPSTLRK